MMFLLILLNFFPSPWHLDIVHHISWLDFILKFGPCPSKIHWLYLKVNADDLYSKCYTILKMKAVSIK